MDAHRGMDISAALQGYGKRQRTYDNSKIGVVDSGVTRISSANLASGGYKHHLRGPGVSDDYQASNVLPVGDPVIGHPSLAKLPRTPAADFAGRVPTPADASILRSIGLL